MDGNISAALGGDGSVLVDTPVENPEPGTAPGRSTGSTSESHGDATRSVDECLKRRQEIHCQGTESAARPLVSVEIGWAEFDRDGIVEAIAAMSREVDGVLYAPCCATLIIGRAVRDISISIGVPVGSFLTGKVLMASAELGIASASVLEVLQKRCG